MVAMNELFPYLTGAIFFLLGLFMTILPQKAVRPPDRGSLLAIRKAKRTGIVLIICVVALIALRIAHHFI